MPRSASRKKLRIAKRRIENRRQAPGASRFGPGLEPLEDRWLLSATWLDDVPQYLPPQHELFQDTGYLTAPSSDPPITIAENYLRAHAGELGILPGDLDNYIVTTNYVTKDTGATTLTFEQSLSGLEVFNANYNITVAANGQLLSVNGGFVPGLSLRAQSAAPTPAMTAQQAIAAAAAGLGLSLPTAPTFLKTESNGVLDFRARGVSLDDITAQLRYVAAPGNDVSLSWKLIIRTPDNRHWYSLDVNSTTGRLQAMVDFAEDADYEVIALPNQNIDEAARTIQTDPQIFSPTPAVVPSPFGWHDTNGVAGPEFTVTSGNNVDAYSDRDADNTPDPGSQPDGGPNLDFSGALVPINPALPPSSYTAAAVTNLFYWANILHDVHYLYGFDEAARNFQVNNYGRGGSGGDPVDAEAQDGSGFDNANFFTPPDGASPRMQMFEWDLTSPFRDGDLEPSIIIHEYGHGVSNRLTGNGNGLFALQSSGMGEGWSDFWSLMLTQTSADETLTGRGVGTYVLGEPLDGQGIRDFKYQFDIADPALETFLDYGIGATQNVEPHAVGTRWAATLWDINSLFIQKYGFESNVYDSTSSAGNIRLLHLVMTALKIQALNPSLLQARDALLMADNLLYGGVDQLELWTAFARRGLGQSASTTDANSLSLTTSFVIPPELLADISIGADVSQLEGDSGTTPFVFSVTVTGAVVAPIHVTYSTAPLTASAGSDFVPQTGTLTFLVGGTTSATVTIQVNGDTEAENNEQFLVALTDPTAGHIGRQAAVGTILNDDVNVSVNDVSVVEGDSGTINAVFTVSTTGFINQSASVSFVTQSGSASAGSDFLARQGLLTFTNAMPFAQIAVPILADKLNEATEQFFVVLSAVQGTRIVRGTGTGTIFDNDPLPSLFVSDVQVTANAFGNPVAVFSINLDVPSGRTVSVQYATADGDATQNADYLPVSGTALFPEGSIKQLVTVDILPTATYAPDEKFFLKLSNPLNAILADAQGVATIIFAPPAKPSRIIDNRDDGFSESFVGWSTATNLLAYHGDFDMHAPGAAADTATWTFTGVQPGEYQVLAHWAPFSTFATNAAYTVFDGSASQGTVLVNERAAPVGDSSEGVVWQSLGMFTSASGTLKVQLGANADGFVIADAIRIVAGGVGPPAPEINVSGFDESIANNAATTTYDNGTSFGAVPAVVGSNTHTFTIVNSGNGDLHLPGGIAISGTNAAEFTVLKQPSGVVVPGGSTTFQLMFRPMAVGDRQAMVTIANDDSDEGPYTFMLDATATDSNPSELTIDDSATAFSSTGAWVVASNAAAFGGQEHTSNPGGSQASWTFTNLPHARYRVYVTWTSDGAQATNAPFTVSDGGSLQLTVPVDQQQTPGDASALGVNWKLLTKIDVSTGLLAVGLGTSANGTVAADAVRIVRDDGNVVVQPPMPPPIQNSVHNAVFAQDVNNDAIVSGIDALVVINYLLTHNASATAAASGLAAGAAPTAQYFMDVSGDGAISPLDALRVINYLNEHAPGANSPGAVVTAQTSSAQSLAASDAAALDALAVDVAIRQSQAQNSLDLAPAGTPSTSRKSRN